MLRRKWRSIFSFLTFLVDAIVIVLSVLVASMLREVIVGEPLNIRYLERATIYLGAVYLAAGLVLGLYRTSFHSNRVQQYKLAARAYMYATLLNFPSFLVIQQGFYPIRFILLFSFLLPIFFILGRMMMYRLNLSMQKKGYGIRNTLIVGYDNGGRAVVDRFTGFPELGYNIKGFVSKVPVVHDAGQPTYSIQDLPMVVEKEKIDRMFIPSSRLVTNGYSDIVELCRKKNIKLKVLSPESDRLLQMTHVHDIAGITLYAPDQTKVALFRRIVKRLFDIVVSSFLILLLSPIFILCALLIYLESGRPIIFKHKRTSVKGGKEFDFYKFRSMIDGAEELREELFKYNESDGALFKMKNDPRMTRVGKFIRKFSIDELPQLFNVLKGDMSLVGPRPLPPEDFNRLEEGPEFWEAVKYRARMKPGITGLWQISGRSHLGFREMILLDLYYVENQSLLFDLEIIFETIPVVLFGQGAY